MLLSESWYDTEASLYRLDIQLGIPQSRLPGALERWMGDPGLCRDPDMHPYLVLAEISARDWGTAQELMQAIACCTEKSEPILVSVRPVQCQLSVPEFSSYQITPSPGLRSFILQLSRICPLIASPGSLADSITAEAPVSFSTIQPCSPAIQHHPSIGTCDPIIHHATSPTPAGSSLKIREPGEVRIEILRLILRRNGQPMAEYDLSQREWFHPTQSVRRKNVSASLRRFRVGKGYQMTHTIHTETPQIYVISDLHLGHANSIPRYKRPFLLSDPREMDRVLIRNWNWTVKEGDAVIFLGDLSYMSPNPPESYIGRLHGSIFMLEGNHDPCLPYMPHCLLMRYRGIPYLFIHNPVELVNPFEGWVIHGHVHNKDLTRYPFLNPHQRTVNVSAELIGYRPISLDEIHHLVMEADRVIRFRDISSANSREGEHPPDDLQPARAHCAGK